MPVLRNSAKAIIIRDGQLLAVRNRDPLGDWYLLPGGGQQFGETLIDALRRECREEIGSEITIGDLVAVREYIGSHHEFADEDSDFHQVEFMFVCELADGETPAVGHEPDQWQTGVAWLPLADLQQYRLYPSILKEWLPRERKDPGVRYFGDVN